MDIYIDCNKLNKEKFNYLNQIFEDMRPNKGGSRRKEEEENRWEVVFKNIKEPFQCLL